MYVDGLAFKTPAGCNLGTRMRGGLAYLREHRNWTVGTWPPPVLAAFAVLAPPAGDLELGYLAVYNRSLTQDQVAALRAQQLNGLPP